MIYPNRSHSISEGEGTTVHVYRKIAKYFVDHLPAGGRRVSSGPDRPR
jgi:dipeptidyl-peptidase-4